MRFSDNPGRLRLGICSALVALGLGGLAYAVHDAGLFELDVVNGQGAANTVDDAVAGDDWADVYDDTSNAFATSFIADTFANNPVTGFLNRTPEVSFFTGGGSKDTLPVADWQYDTLNDVVPDKNDTVNAFAAAYDDADDHVIFYFGVDTYSVDGTNTVGFWFFRQPVGLNPLAANETTGTFFGEHTEGDILVVADFSGGGGVDNINVYKWDATLQNNGKPKGPVLIISGASCATAAANDDVCGVVNRTNPGEDPPWGYINKDGNQTYQAGAFVEFGLDVTALLGENIGCFSSFLGETRSANSLTAQLKDFAVGAFPVCGIEVDKTSETDISKVGDEVSYTINIENTGRATLYRQSIIDSLIGDLTDGTNTAIDSSNCGASLVAGATCTITLSYTVAAGDVMTDDGGNTILANEVTIVYTEFDDFTGLAFNESDGHVIDLFEPAIKFTKTGTPTIMVEGTQVSYEITLTGDSSGDTPTMDCTITDTALGINQVVQLTATGEVKLTPSKTWDFVDDAAYCTGAGDIYECKNTAKVTCDIEGFEGLNELDEEASVTVTVIPANIALSITKDCSDYSKVNTWEGWTTDDAIDYEIVITNESGIPLNLVSIDDSVLGDLTAECTSPLAAGATCTINKSYVVTQDGDELTNSVTVTFNDGLGGGNITTDPPVSCTTDLVHPSLTVDKSCASPDPVPAGSTANFEIRITNTGDTNLDINVVDNHFDTPIDLDVLLGTAPQGGCLDGDYGDGGGIPAADAADGCLLIEGGITATGTQVFNQVDVTATLPAIFGLSNVLTRTNDAVCDVQQGDATRTWGFWKTHGSDGDLFDDPVERGYTCHIFEDHLGGTMNLGWKQVNSCEDLFAIFWAHRSREDDGSKRGHICQAQVRCSGQVAAALLNTGLDNGAALDSDDLAAVLDALANGNRKAINKACAPIAAYNESGDDVMIIDNDGAMIPHADPNGTRGEANYPFADCN